MDRERRKIERHPCTVLGSYEGSGNKPWGLKCLDISAAGAGLASFECLPVNTRLGVNLCTETEKPLFAEGTVRWCTKASGEWRAGIEFTKRIISPLTMVM